MPPGKFVQLSADDLIKLAKFIGDPILEKFEDAIKNLRLEICDEIDKKIASCQVKQSGKLPALRDNISAWSTAILKLGTGFVAFIGGIIFVYEFLKKIGIIKS